MIKNFIVNIPNAFGQFETRGVSLRLFQAVRDLALQINQEEKHWMMSRLSAMLVGNHEILKPNNRWSERGVDPEATLTFLNSSSLIDLLRDKYLTECHPTLNVTYSEVVGRKANVFISFAYGNDFIDLVDALEVYFEEHPDMPMESTYFWFDMFVNNQWQATEKDFDWWATTFRTAVRDIGHTLLFLSPCLDPVMLTRAWCLYEMSCSVKISVALSRNELYAFQSKLLHENSDVLAALSRINLARCECFLEEDKRRIFDVVERMDGGLQAVNILVMDLIRNWVQRAANDMVAKVSGSTTLSVAQNIHSLDAASIIHVEHGMFDEAQEMLERAICLADSTEGLDERVLFSPLVSLGKVYRNKSMYQKARVTYNRALDITERVYGVEGQDTLSVVNNLAMVLHALQMTDEAKNLFERAIEGFTKIHGASNIHALNSTQNLAVLYKRQQNYAKAIPMYQQVLEGYEILYGPDHRQTLLVIDNYAVCLSEVGGRDEEVNALFKRSFDTFERTLGREHPDTLMSAASHSRHLFETGKWKQAVDKYERILGTIEKVFGMWHEVTLASVEGYAQALLSIGEMEKLQGLLRRYPHITG
jgi:tetratricopeptide (TPR) repeat protein